MNRGKNQKKEEITMLNGAKGSRIKIVNTEMEYVTFGKGKKTLVIIPGLSDGLKTVKGTAAAIGMMYKNYGKKYRVFVFSRKNQLEEGYTTRQMAKDQKEALNQLGITKASIIGISQGGMIAQYLAIDYPELVEKLTIGVSVSRQNDTIQGVVNSWIEMAEAGDYKNIVIDSMEKTYTDDYIKRKRYRLMYPLITRIGRPKDFRRFIIQAKACLSHNAFQELEKIQCPTLVIGGDSDKVVGANSSEEMAEKIPGCKLVIYHGLGHGAYAETKEFDREVLEFLKNPRSPLPQGSWNDPPHAEDC